MSKNGGGGDITRGMELVYRFLYFVALLRPRWWVMENVPRVLHHLPAAGGQVPYAKLGLKGPGGVPIPRIVLLNSADFGVPQQRLRAFVGDFPPPRTKRARRTLGDVVQTLPDPLLSIPVGTIPDPVYRYKVQAADLSDHFGLWCRLREAEVRENSDLKSDHGFYGHMAFPDELSKPARTQMATIHRIAREATIVATGTRGYRLLTVRETASVQGFPVTYQWLGRTAQERYRLIGNAVAPPVAFSIAQAIRSAAKLPDVQRPARAQTLVVHHDDESPRDLSNVRGSLARSFHWHVPGVRERGFRVELDNLGGGRSLHPVARGPRGGRVPHLRVWRAVLHHGTGKGRLVRPYRRGVALEELIGSGTSRSSAEAFVRAAVKLVRCFPDATSLQSAYANRTAGPKPKDLLRQIADLVDDRFPSELTSSSRSAIDRSKLPTRIAAALVACSIAVEQINAEITVESACAAYIPTEWKDRGISLATAPPLRRAPTNLERHSRPSVPRRNSNAADLGRAAS